MAPTIHQNASLHSVHTQPHTHTHTGGNPLHLAASQGRMLVVMVSTIQNTGHHGALSLTDTHTHTRTRTHTGDTPLHLAADQGHLAVVMQLLQLYMDQPFHERIRDPRTVVNSAGLRPHQVCARARAHECMCMRDLRAFLAVNRVCLTFARPKQKRACTCRSLSCLTSSASPSFYAPTTPCGKSSKCMAAPHSTGACTVSGSPPSFAPTSCASPTYTHMCAQTHVHTQMTL